MRYKEACLWIGIPIAILCIWVLLFCIPWVSQMESKKRELNDLEARIARIQAQLSQPGNKALIESGKAKHPMTPDQIPRLEAFPSFMRRMASSVGNGAVTINRLNGRLDKDKGGSGSAFAYPVTEIGFTGRFLDIGRMLEQIQNVKAYRRIVKARLTTVEDTYPELRGSVEIEFKAWRD